MSKTNFDSMKGYSPVQLARFLAEVYIDGLLYGYSLGVCEEGQEPEEVTQEDVNEAMSAHGDALTDKFLHRLMEYDGDKKENTDEPTS